MTYTEQYLPYIKKLANKYHKRFLGYVDRDEAISAAILACLRAERVFNPEKGNFAAYVHETIRGAVIRAAVGQNRSAGVLRKIQTFVKRYEDELGTTPIPYEIKEALELDDATYDSAVNYNSIKLAFDITEIQDVEDTDEVLDIHVELDKLLLHLVGEDEQYINVIQDFLQEKVYDMKKFNEAISVLREKAGIHV